MCSCAVHIFIKETAIVFNKNSSNPHQKKLRSSFFFWVNVWVHVIYVLLEWVVCGCLLIVFNLNGKIGKWAGRQYTLAKKDVGESLMTTKTPRTMFLHQPSPTYFCPNYLPLFLAISSLLSGCGFFLLGVLEAASFWTTSRLLSRVSWQHLT